MEKIKNRWHYLHISNDVVTGNLIAFFLGGLLAEKLFMHRLGDMSHDMLIWLAYVDDFYGLVSIFVVTIVTMWYEMPVRKCLKRFHRGEACDKDLLAVARQRVLNEPFIIVGVDILAWTIGFLVFWIAGSPNVPGLWLASGMITAVLVFFWMEHVSQRHLVPLFFPKGDLSTVKGGKSIGLKFRFSILIIAVSVVPLTYIHLTISQLIKMYERGRMDQALLIQQMEKAIAVESALFLVVAVGLSWLVLRTLQLPVAEIVQVMGYVKKGDFSRRATVYANDEIGFAAETLNTMTKGLKERELIKDTFGRYVDTRIRDEILQGKIPLDGELKQATILFADLRNFTPLVAVTPPKTMIYILNAYFNEMEKAIVNNGGLILQFIGDEVEAVFGAPVYEPDHELSAVRTALDMRRRLALMNKKLVSEGLSPIAHGIGIHTGDVLAANIGSEARSAYSLIGDTVNMASRIQGLTKEMGTDILVSACIQKKVDNQYHFHAMPPIKVKGKDSPIQVFSLDS